MKLLDTTVLVDHQRGEDAVALYLGEVEDENEALATTTVNLKEISVGKMMLEEPRPGIEDVLGDFGWLEVIPFSERDALEAASIEAGLRDAGEYRRGLAADLLIAGAARARDATVVTRDVSDFELFEGVETESY